MEKIINRLIDEAVVNVDKYVNNNSTWLIFTESKQWVIELTKDGTLWYNYNFFKNLFVYMSMDVVENQHYITKWVEDTIINGVKHTQFHHSVKWLSVEDTIINGVKHTDTGVLPLFSSVEDAIQNGAKEITGEPYDYFHTVEGIIQNGVKETHRFGFGNEKDIEDTIQNGIKETNPTNFAAVEDTIQNGVKETKSGAPDNRNYFIEDTIQNGVKETINENHHRFREVVVTLKNGVKEVTGGKTERLTIVNETIQNGVKETLWMNGDSTNWGFEVDSLFEGHDKIEDAINNGIKEVQPLPAQDGNRDWGNYYHGKEDRTKPFNEYLNDVIENGIKI